MTLHIGTETMHDDERHIGKGYQKWLSPFLVIGPLAAAYYLEQKWVVAIGIGAVLVMLHEIGGRLHDLCIRQRRTNILSDILRMTSIEAPNCAILAFQASLVVGQCAQATLQEAKRPAASPRVPIWW